MTPHNARARDFVNFRRKKFMHRARGGARGFDSLPSLSDVGTLSFRWIDLLPFWYFCLRDCNKASLALLQSRKQKYMYQNGSIHRKLKVPTSEREGQLSNPRGRAARARCMEKIYGNLRKPARGRRAWAMHWFCRGQEYSTIVHYFPLP
jgi:hypothetical protein